MINRPETTSLNRMARCAGVLYLVITALAIFSMLFVPNLIVPGDAEATATRIIASDVAFDQGCKRLSAG